MSEKTNEKKRLSTANIVGIILMAVFLPIIIINMVLVIKGAVHKDQVPMIFNRAPLVVATDSMTKGHFSGNDGEYTGAFNKNDLIIVRKVDPEKLEIGDIATYMNGRKEVVTHRIIDKQLAPDGKIEYTFKGDNSPSQDAEAVIPEQIVGKYEGHRFAFIGWVIMQIQKPVGIITLILLPVAVFFIVVLIQKQRENKVDASKTAALEAEIERLKNEKKENESNLENK